MRFAHFLHTMLPGRAPQARASARVDNRMHSYETRIPVLHRKNIP